MKKGNFVKVMSREEFIEKMKRLKELEVIEGKIAKGFKLLDTDFNGFNLGKAKILILDLLKVAMNDKYDYIEYFIYETGWGKDGKDCITEKDGKTKRSLTNFGELYNYIVNNENL